MATAVDISGLPPPPGAKPEDGDISGLPPPPGQQAATGIEHLPPPAADISGLPPPAARRNEEDLKARNAIEPEEVESIGAKHGLSKDQVENLKNLTPYLGAHLSTEEEGLEGVVSGAKEAVGLAGRAMLGAPQWLAKQVLSTPERAAWDEVQALADERKSTGRRLAEAGGELAVGAAALPLGAAQGLGGAVKTGAAIGGAQGFFSSKEGEGVGGAVKGAIGGAVTGGVLHGLASGARAVGEWAARSDVVDAKVNALAGRVQQELDKPEVQADMQAGAARVASLARAPEAVEALAPEHATDAVQFAQWLKSPGKAAQAGTAEATEKGLAGAVQTISDWAGPRGEQALQREYGRFREAQAVTEAAADGVRRGAFGVFGTPNKVTQAARSLVRARVEAGIIDDATQGITRFESHLDNLALADTTYKRDVAQKSLGLGPLWREMQTRGLTSLDHEAIGALEDGDLSRLTPEQRETWGKYQQAFESMRQEVNARYGEEVITPVEGKAHYVPRMQKDSGQTSRTVLDFARRAGEEVGTDLLGKDITDETLARLGDSEAGQELSRQVKYLAGVRQNADLDPQEFQATLRQAIDPEGASRLDSNRLLRGPAGVARARVSPDEPTLPDSLRETDLARLQFKWTAAALRDAHTADVVADIAADTAKLRAMGATSQADYMTRYLQDYNGLSDTVPRALAKQKSAFMAKMSARADDLEKAGKTTQAALYRDLSGNADLAGVLMSGMYGNMLGARPSTAMKALLAPVVSTFPELAGGGPAWAMAKMAGAAMRLTQRLATGEMPAAYKALTEEGWMPTHVYDELSDSFRKGMESSSLTKGLRKAVDAWSNAMLAPLQWAESSARLLAQESASGIAKDLQAGSQAGLRFLDRMGRGYQAEVQDLIRIGDWDGVERSLQKFLVGKTLHYYSPTQMSELGRSMGRLVSAFGTWPTSVAGDVARDYIRRGALGGTASLLRKQLAPLAALWAAQHFASAGGWDPEQSPRAKALLGASGLTGAAPFPEAMKRMSQPMETPVLQDVGEAVSALVSADPQKMTKMLNKVGGTFVPFAGLVPLVDTTLPALLQNREGPDKAKSFPERLSDAVRGRR